MSAIELTKNVVFHSRTKHIDIRHHFIRDLVAKKLLEVKHCNTHQQVADILTKSLASANHEYFRLQMGVCNFESREHVG